MEGAERDHASFRDPAGQVVRAGNRILRTVTERGAADYEFVRDSGLLRGLAASNQVIGSAEISFEDSLPAGIREPKYLLEHLALAFVSYPYEWCFSALQSAALLQLDLLLKSLEHDVTLSDASAYNIQFQGPNPIFIDTLSFRRYQEGDYWIAHQQFCEQFLNPLLLTARCGIAFNAWFRGSMEGIRSEDLNRLLSWRQKLNWRVLTHVVLPLRLQSNARANSTGQIDQVKKRRLPRGSFRQLIGGLRKWVAELKPAAVGPSVWREYTKENTYDAAAAEAKAKVTRQFASTVKPKMLWDAGCNTGHYTEIALQAGVQEAIGFDIDTGAVEAAFARAVQSKLRFLPLVMDAANPSPDQGWLGRERMSVEIRKAADGLLAYAFLHHLSIGRNIPLRDVTAWLIGLAPQGVIEFVDKEDPMVQLMLRLRGDIFDDYHRENFLATVREHAEIVETTEIIAGRRLLVWYRRAPN
jgi:ribosomal protein L11 methylase PrmA